jgi:hypothetical protein
MKIGGVAIGLIAAVCLGCDPAGMYEAARLYHPDLAPEALDTKVFEMARVMPFYVVGAALSLLLMGVAFLNALDHARAIGRNESIRFGAYVMLLCFVGLFLAMSAQRSWLPAGQAVPAFAITAVISALATALAAKLRPDRAVLAVGYMAATIALPILGLLLSTEIYLVDTTAALFIGFATGLLCTIVLSDPVRGGLVDFLKRRDA